MRQVQLVARDPDGVVDDELITLELPDPVVDEVVVDGKGRTIRRWKGDQSLIEANKLVNPLTAYLFEQADLVRVSTEPERWEWIRKSDGRVIVQNIPTR